MPKPRRDSLLTSARASAIVGHLQAGLPKSTAAAMEGVSKQLLQFWLNEGEKILEEDPESSDPFATFAIAANRALAEYQKKLLERLDVASVNPKQVDHKPIKFLLQTRFSKDYTIPSQAPGARDEDAPEMVTPDQARLTVAAKLAEYLKTNPLEETAQSAPAGEAAALSQSTGAPPAGAATPPVAPNVPTGPA